MQFIILRKNMYKLISFVFCLFLACYFLGMCKYVVYSLTPRSSPGLERICVKYLELLLYYGMGTNKTNKFWGSLTCLGIVSINNTDNVVYHLCPNKQGNLLINLFYLHAFQTMKILFFENIEFTRILYIHKQWCIKLFNYPKRT